MNVINVYIIKKKKEHIFVLFSFNNNCIYIFTHLKNFLYIMYIIL